MTCDWEEKKSIAVAVVSRSSAKPGFRVVITHVILYLLKEDDEARKEIYLV